MHFGFSSTSSEIKANELCTFRFKLINTETKKLLTIFTVYMLLVSNSFIKNLFITKSCKSDLVNGHASKP